MGRASRFATSSSYPPPSRQFCGQSRRSNLSLLKSGNALSRLRYLFANCWRYVAYWCNGFVLHSVEPPNHNATIRRPSNVCVVMLTAKIKLNIASLYTLGAHSHECKVSLHNCHGNFIYRVIFGLSQAPLCIVDHTALHNWCLILLFFFKRCQLDAFGSQLRSHCG